MFIREIISPIRHVDGKKFVERTIQSRFNKANVSITTIIMNDKPLLKQYEIQQGNKIKQYWKSMTTKQITKFERFA